MSQQGLTVRFSIQQCLHWAVIGIMIPVITLIFQAKGLSLLDIGVVMAVWIGSTTLLEIPLGSVADKYGRRKTYLCSLAVNALGCLTLYWASGYEWVLVAAALLGASRAIYSGTLDAWFYESYQRLSGDRTFHSAIAQVNVAVTVGLAFGALFGGWLPDYIGDSFHQAGSIYNINMLLASFASVLLAVITCCLIDEEGRQVGNSKAEANLGTWERSLMAMKYCYRDATLNRLMQLTLIFGMALSGIENYWQPYLAQIITDTSYGVTVFGVISALYFLMSALSSVFSLQVLQWVGRSHHQLIALTRLFAGLIFTALAYTSSMWGFSVGYLAFFFCLTLGNNSESVLINEHSDQQLRSTMLSISSFIVTAGGVIASLIFGFVAEHYGISMSWIICGILLALSSYQFFALAGKGQLKRA